MTPRAIAKLVATRKAAKEQSAREWLARWAPRTAVEIQPEPEPAPEPTPIRPVEREFDGSDLRAVDRIYRLIVAGSEDATAEFLSHLPEVYRVGATLESEPATFGEWSASIRDALATKPQGAGHYEDSLRELLAKAREYQRERRESTVESELSALASSFVRSRGAWTSLDPEGFVQAASQLPHGKFDAIRFALATGDSVTIPTARLHKLLACRDSWVSFTVTMTTDGLCIRYRRAHGHGQVTLANHPMAPTACVLVGRANDNAIAA